MPSRLIFAKSPKAARIYIMDSPVSISEDALMGILKEMNVRKFSGRHQGNSCQRQSSFVMTIFSGLALISSVMLIMLYVTRGMSIPKRLVECSTHMCESYASLLNTTLTSSRAPCEDFYGFVCGGWTKTQQYSVAQIAVKQFKEEVARSARSLLVPERFQTPTEKAALLYQSCENVIAKQQSEVFQVTKMMESSGLGWPQRQTVGDILDSILPVNALWKWGNVIRAQMSPDGNRLLLQPCGLYKMLLDRRQKMVTEAKYESYYDLLKMLYGKDLDDQVSAQDMISIEELVVPRLKAALCGTSFNVTTTWDNMSSLTPTVTDSRWKTAISRYFNIPRNRTIHVDVQNVAFFTTLFQLTEEVGTTQMHSYVGWIVAQMTSMISNAEIISYYYGNYDKALNEQKNLCFNITRFFMGYAFYSAYIDSAINKEHQKDVARLVATVRTAFDTTVEEKPYSQLHPGVPRIIGGFAHLFDFIEKCRLPNLQKMFGNFSDMSPAITVNWFHATSGLQRSNYRPRDFIGDNAEFYALEPEESEFLLLPHSMVAPVYDIHAPLGAKYGALGSQIGVALSELLFRDNARATADRLKLLHRALCQLGRNVSAKELTSNDWEMIHRTVSLDPLWSAFQSMLARVQPQTLLNYTEAQLFFIFWCYLKCGEPSGSELCNEPLRRTPYFADEFNCPETSPMTSRMAWCSA